MEQWNMEAKEYLSAQQLWCEALMYFKWCVDNPIQLEKTLMSGNNAGNTVVVKRVRPFSLKALCLFCGTTEELFKDIRNSKNKDSDWYVVVSKILYIIYTQIWEMSMIDEFNAMLASKTLGMDKDEQPAGTIKVEIVQGLPPLSESENEVLEKLESENKIFEN